MLSWLTPMPAVLFRCEYSSPARGMTLQANPILQIIEIDLVAPEETRCRNERRRSMRCFGGLPAIRAPLMAPIDIPFCRMLLLGASRGDGDRSAHRLVPGATKNVAKEGERTYLVGHKAHSGGLAGNDVRPNVEVGRIEAHEDIGRREFQNNRDAPLQAEFVGRVGESPGQYLDDLLPGL